MNHMMTIDDDKYFEMVRILYNNGKGMEYFDEEDYEDDEDDEDDDESAEPFQDVTATAYYPADDSTWTEEGRTVLGSTLNWVAKESTVVVPGTNPDTDPGEGSGEDPSTNTDTDTRTLVESGKYNVGGNTFTWNLYDNGALVISGNGKLNDCPGNAENDFFRIASKVKEIEFKDGITELGDNLFPSFENLKKVTIGKDVTKIGHAFINYSSPVENFTVADENPVYCSIDGVIFSKDKTELIQCPCGRKGDYVVPDGVTTIRKDAFKPCDKLDSITVSKTVKNIDNEAFTFAWNAEILSDPANPYFAIEDNVIFNTNKTELIKCATSKTGSYTIPSSVTSIRSSAFADCEKLTQIEIPDSVKEIGEKAFLRCWGLKSINIPNGVSEIKNYTFSCCEKLNSITIPGSVKTIGRGAFSRCDGLKTVRFEGKMPSVAASTEPFEGIKANAFYPDNDSSWTESGKMALGKKLVWEVKATEDEQNDIIRIYGDDRYETSLKIADTLKDLQGVTKFKTIIVATGENYADSLAGSYLSYKKGNAPIISIPKGAGDTQNKVIRYIKKNISSDGQIYILGGKAAIPENVERQLGNNVKRLAGESRYETNLVILSEAGVSGANELLVGTGNNFADSLSASSTGKPILLVNKTMTADQTDFVDRYFFNKKISILGGENAVSKAVFNTLEEYSYSVERIAGSTRYDTSRQIAEKYFRNAEKAVLAYGETFPDGLAGGPLAMQIGAPVILANQNLDNANVVAGYTKSKKINAGYVLGGPGLVTNQAVETILGK